ncbi:MAG TPA: YncE family protein [Methylocella sp.]|nr:YncE family protein [Methylocella sp.]
MQADENGRMRAFCARGSAALWAILALAGILSALPAEAAPFAYVANTGTNNVSVIDTATNEVETTIGVGFGPEAIAVTPDGSRAYVVGGDPGSGFVAVIDTASNTVVAVIPVGALPHGVAVTPDGKHAYVTNFFSESVSVIDTATNMVLATVHLTTFANTPISVAVTPDGKYAYVAGGVSGHPPTPIPNVFIIDTASNTVVAGITLGNANAFPAGIAITPDGKHAYVPTSFSTLVSVIATATNTVVATVTAGSVPFGVAVTPDGKRAYVTNNSPNTVSVITTITNTVVATVPVGGNPGGVGIIPPPPGVPFSAFSAKLAFDLDHKPNHDAFRLMSHFTLGQSSNGIDPVTEPVTLRLGSFTTIIPAGSFMGKNFGPFAFHGMIGGVDLHVEIEPTGAKRYDLMAEARDANLTGTTNPVPVTLVIGDDSGTVSVKADIDQDLARRDDN